MPISRPYWETTPLQEMTLEQWEALCDQCGRCCLHKLRDDETDEVYYTSVACRLLDVQTCQCTDYVHRLRCVRDCVTLTADMIPKLDWLPLIALIGGFQKGVLCPHGIL